MTTRPCRRARGEWKDTKKWNSYLRNETNKIELFQYLSGVIAQSDFDEGKVVAASQGAFLDSPPSSSKSTRRACQLWMHKKLCRKVLMLQEGRALCAQPDANMLENVTSSHQLATNTIEHESPLYIKIIP